MVETQLVLQAATLRRCDTFLFILSFVWSFFAVPGPRFLDSTAYFGGKTLIYGDFLDHLMPLTMTQLFSCTRQVVDT